MGLNVSDVMSAETAFMKARRKEVDVVVAMYHDQGLAPLKLLEFGQAVNWTQGLPIIRTSVDHGTAEDLVGLNQANPESLIAAWDLAHQIASGRYSGHSGRGTSAQISSKEVSSPTHV
jgi:4-hydroxythreonine-4-phosphate dehydrogenase